MRSFSQRSCETDSRTTLGERPFQKTYAKNNVRINLDEGRLWGSLPTFIIRKMDCLVSPQTLEPVRHLHRTDLPLIPGFLDPSPQRGLGSPENEPYRLIG